MADLIPDFRRTTTGIFTQDALIEWTEAVIAEAKAAGMREVRMQHNSQIGGFTLEGWARSDRRGGLLIWKRL